MKFRSFKSKGGIIQLLWVVCVLLAVFRSYFHLKSSAETAAFAAAIAIGLLVSLFLACWEMLCLAGTELSRAVFVPSG